MPSGAVQVKVDAAKLRQRLALTNADYTTTLNSMAALCSDLIQEKPASSSKQKRGRPSGEEEGKVRSSCVCLCTLAPCVCLCVY